MQFRVIVVTDPQRPPARCKHTDRTDYNTQYTAPLSLARSVINNVTETMGKAQ